LLAIIVLSAPDAVVVAVGVVAEDVPETGMMLIDQESFSRSA
jgi:hypothetical protein